MPSLRPITARLGQRMAGAGASIVDEAVERVELSPAATRPTLAAIALPDELDRVGSFRQDTPAAMQMERLTAPTARHGATIAYRLRDAVVADGAVLGRRRVETLRPATRRKLLPPAPAHYPEAQLATVSIAETFFGHWLSDAWPLEQLAADRGHVPLTVPRKPWSHEAGYRALLGLATVPVAHAAVDSLWLIDDRGLNDGRADRTRRLRARLRAAAPPAATPLVFMQRGHRNATGRVLVNEGEVADALVARGFTVLNPEDESAARVASVLGGARIVVTVEGSAMSHAMYAQPDRAGLIAIQPRGNFSAWGKAQTDLVGHRFGYSVADGDGETLTQPIDRLLRTVELMDRALG